MSAVVEWTLDRPPNLDKDFPDDRANGERARDVWYERRRRPDDKALPVVDLLASQEVQKQQQHERSMLWKKALRRYNNAQRDKSTDKNAEAQRKRSARLLTNLQAGLGDAEAQSRLDAEAERGRRRRSDAKERAQQLQNTIDTARAQRAQQAVKAVAIEESVRWAVEQRERPKLPWDVHKYPSHFQVLTSLARAHYAAQHPPDGSTDWDAAVEQATSKAKAESEAMRFALLDWDILFDPDYVEPWPFDPYGFYQLGPNHDYHGDQMTDVDGIIGAPFEHRWARAPVPLPSVLLSWLQQELQQQLETWPTLRSAPRQGEAAEGEAEAQYQEHTYEDAFEFEGFGLDDFWGLDAEQGPSSGSDTEEEASDLEWSMAEEPLPPPPSTVETEWWELSRAQKAHARLLGFRSHNWHRKQVVITCVWAELCNEEQAAACRLGFDKAQWDTYAPEPVPVPAKPTAAQLETALQFVATQLKQTRDAVQQLCQVCMHPFQASREPPARLEPASWEPDSAYFPAWCGLLYDVHSVRQTVVMPPFVRPHASRRSARNPNGFCREHRATFWTPINVHKIRPDLACIWEDRSCDCAIGAPGLQPCSICGKGLGQTSDEQCYEDVCCEVVRFYRNLCYQLEDGLSKADRAQEKERQSKLELLMGKNLYSIQEHHLELRIRGLQPKLILE